MGILPFGKKRDFKHETEYIEKFVGAGIHVSIGQVGELYQVILSGINGFPISVFDDTLFKALKLADKQFAIRKVQDANQY